MRTELAHDESPAQSPQPAPARAELREQIRDQLRQGIEQARLDAQRAQEEARVALQQAGAAASPPAPAAPPVPGVTQVQVAPGGGQIIVLPDGRTLEVSPEGDVMLGGDPIVEVDQGPPPGFPFGPGGPRIPVEAVVIAIAFFAMIVAIAVGIPIARAFGRRIDKRTANAPALAELAQRLDGIEQAIETVAVEVERISEGQRYSARLMTELQQAQRIAAGGGER